MHVEQPLNHMAILVSAIILWVLGAVWYSPALFAKPWMSILGLKKEDSRRSFVYLGMVGSFVGDVIMAFVLAHIILWAGATGFWLGGVTGILIWFGFFAAPNLPQHLYENRPFKLFAINNAYWLLGLFVVGGLLATWR